LKQHSANIHKLWSKACEHPTHATRAEMMQQFRIAQTTYHGFAMYNFKSCRWNRSTQRERTGAHTLAPPAMARHRQNWVSSDAKLHVAAAALSFNRKLQLRHTISPQLVRARIVQRRGPMLH